MRSQILRYLVAGFNVHTRCELANDGGPTILGRAAKHLIDKGGQGRDWRWPLNRKVLQDESETCALRGAEAHLASIASTITKDSRSLKRS
jgi:hypothetical protein